VSRAAFAHANTENTPVSKGHSFFLVEIGNTSENFDSPLSMTCESEFCWCFRVQPMMRGFFRPFTKLDLCSFCAETEACFSLFSVAMYFCTVWCRLKHRYFGFVHVDFFLYSDAGR
jgi:hypothetical protein